MSGGPQWGVTFKNRSKIGLRSEPIALPHADFGISGHRAKAAALVNSRERLDFFPHLFDTSNLNL